MTVANTILQQLGGRKFIVMTGASNLSGSADCLSFKIGRNSGSVSHIRVTLLPFDTYKMEFLRVRALKVNVVKTFEDIYCDQLQELFTEVTGMHTRLF